MRRIVYTNPDGAVSALELYDNDVIGLPITITVYLQAVWHRVKPGTFQPISGLDADPWFVWLLESKENYQELWNYAMDIIDEHEHRFGSQATHPYRHGSTSMIERLGYIPELPEVPQTPRPSTPLEGYKTLTGYWATYTNREKPTWLSGTTPV